MNTVNRTFFALFITLFLLASCSHYVPTTEAESMSGSMGMRLANKNKSIGDAVFIRIFKEEQQLEVWLQHKKGHYERFGVYPICIFSGTLGPKRYEGDKQAPEGFYQVPLSALNPNSEFHRSFDLGFPNAFDRANGYTGSYLMVHGGCSSAGCYAMNDLQIEEIYTLVEAALLNGQRSVDVHAFPFRMTKERMERAKQHPAYTFWKQLQPAYNYFNRKAVPPHIEVVNGRYIIK